MEAPRIHFDGWLARMNRQCTPLGKSLSMHSWATLLSEMMRLRELGNAEELRDLFLRSENANIYMSGRRSLYEFASVYGTMLAFIESGRQVYNLSPELIDAFRETTLKNLKWEDLRLPYGCFYIALPPGTFSLWGGYEAGYLDACGIYLRTAYDFEKCVSDFCLQVNTPAPSPSDGDQDETYSWIGFSKSQFDAEGGFEELIQAIFNHDRGYKAPGIDANPHRKREQIEVLRESIRIAVNMCCYLQQPSERIDTRLDLKQEDNRKRFENAHRGHTRAVKEHKAVKRVTRISGVRLQHVGFSRDPLDRRKLETGHMVSAHWHHYWCGIGRTILELRWVFDYFKHGSDGKSQIETYRTYEVKE